MKMLAVVSCALFFAAGCGLGHWHARRVLLEARPASQSPGDRFITELSHALALTDAERARAKEITQRVVEQQRPLRVQLAAIAGAGMDEFERTLPPEKQTRMKELRKTWQARWSANQPATNSKP